MSDDLRKAICNMSSNNLSYQTIANQLNISKSTVASIVQKFKKTGECSGGHSSGRPEKLTEREKRLLKMKIKPLINSP